MKLGAWREADDAFGAAAPVPVPFFPAYSFVSHVSRVSRESRVSVSVKNSVWIEQEVPGSNPLFLLFNM